MYNVDDDDNDDMSKDLPLICINYKIVQPSHICDLLCLTLILKKVKSCFYICFM